MTQPMPPNRALDVVHSLPAAANSRLLRALLVGALGFTLAGCSNSSAPEFSEAELSAAESPVLDHVHNELILLENSAAVAQAFQKAGVAHYQQETPFQQVGLFYRAQSGEALQWRVRFTDGKWGAWAAVEVTWQEDDLHVGRVILEREAMELELRGATGMRWAQVEFFDKVVARRDGVLARDLPFAKPEEDRLIVDSEVLAEHVDLGDFATTRQKVAPRSLVIPRSEWGARSPGKICGSVVAPYRMAIHHTYSPATDGADAASAMRGMQAYHMDTQGWCDIGYHFVVSQAGKVYQGRSDERRPGAHVGNQNSGNVGICLIGNFQPGYSTSRQPSDTQLKAAGSIVGWVHRTYNIPLNRTAIKGHREHAGQSTSCPGTNLLNKLPTILTYAAGGGGTTTPPADKYDVSVQVKWKGTENFYTQGSSASIADALPGARFQAEILIKNKSTAVIRQVWAGYSIPSPYLKATNYKIYTDHPKLDGSTWKVNDADEEPENPARNAMGSGGKFNLNAFSPNETKRILVDLEATQYSIDAQKHADLRAWLHKANNASAKIYGDQTAWDGSVSTNTLGQKVQGYARVDVLERDTWLFNDTRDDANLEGWSGQPADHVAQLKLNTSSGALALKVGGNDARLIAPAWTEINADQYDQLVLRMRSHDGAHRASIFWASADESFSDERQAQFEAPGDTEFHDLVIPLSAHPAWGGTVKKLRIDPLDEAAPGADDSGWYDLDHVFFQSSADRSTSAPGVAYVDSTPVTLINLQEDPGAGPGEEQPQTPQPEAPTDPEQPTGPADPTEPTEPTTPDSPGEDTPNKGSNKVMVNSGGCSASAAAAPLTPASAAWLFLVGGAGLMVRRRYAARSIS